MAAGRLTRQRASYDVRFAVSRVPAASPTPPIASAPHQAPRYGTRRAGRLHGLNCFALHFGQAAGVGLELQPVLWPSLMITTSGTPCTKPIDLKIAASIGLRQPPFARNARIFGAPRQRRCAKIACSFSVQTAASSRSISSRSGLGASNLKRSFPTNRTRRRT